jgi:hypothetical protein
MLWKCSNLKSPVHWLKTPAATPLGYCLLWKIGFASIGWTFRRGCLRVCQISVVTHCSCHPERRKAMALVMLVSWELSIECNARVSKNMNWPWLSLHQSNRRRREAFTSVLKKDYESSLVHLGHFILGEYVGFLYPIYILRHNTLYNLFPLIEWIKAIFALKVTNDKLCERKIDQEQRKERADKT